MQHFKALVVLVCFVAVCISFTEAWHVGHGKVGKRDGKEPVRDYNRPRMDDEARLEARRNHIEDWVRRRN
ncbi:hypothetical protein OS493_005036 [Desmophyllum pertusum]|uniref:Uncharacterized protein n=1 Tax=Desmophyllum pertusum TaxID=174260 RepID=A0A9W9Z7A9_9CNID|nr:hypothetical protein OS493_005036 [Desmophyllum pertusum]